MPAFLIAAFKTYILPKLIQLAVSWAVKHGMVTNLEANLAKFGMSLRSIDQYPSGRNGTFGDEPKTPNNLTVNQPTA